MKSEEKEQYVIILDYLQNGYSYDKTPSHKKTPIAQGIGISNFTLLELVPKKEVLLKPLEKVYIGEGKRDKIHHINGKIGIKKLTGNAKMELQYVIEEIIKKDEQKYVDFYNNSQALSMRMHQLELLPGLGKKHMWEIIDERKGDPFKNFEDMKSRLKNMSDPKKLIIKRIMLELEGDQKYYLFVDK